MAVTIPILADPNFRNASRDVSRFATRTRRQLNSIGNSFKALNTLAAGFVGFLAARGLFNAIQNVTNAAAQQEDAVNALNSSLQLAGEFTQEASESFQEFASSLQQTSVFGDEVILQQIALARNFARTNEEAQKLIRAAVDLSAATGISLDSAVRNLGKTFSGLQGEIGESVSQIRSLTEEQLRAGEALNVVIDRFGGAAVRQLRTFSGALSQLQNTFGDTQEAIGNLIVQNPLVIDAINLLNTAFLNLQRRIADNEDEGRRFINGVVVSIVKSLPTLITGINEAVKAFRGLVTVFDLVRTAASGLVAQFNAIASGGGLDKFLEVSAAFDEKLLRIIEESAAGLEQQDKIFAALAEEASKFAEEVEKAARNAENLPDSIDIEGNVDLKIAPQSAQEIRQEVDALIKSPFAGLTGDIEAVGAGTQKVIAGFAGVTQAALKGADGARQLISNSIGAAADALIPGVGAVVGEIVNVLAQGPEKVRELVNSFVQAIPDIITNIIQAIPALIDALIDAIPALVQRLIEAVPTIIRSLIAGIPEFISSLVAAVPEIITSFIKEIPRITSELIAELPNIAANFIKSLISEAPRFIEALIDAINPFSSGDDGTTGFGPADAIIDPIVGLGKSIGNIFGLQSGGVIPPGFPNDSFPAALTSGEAVITSDTTRKLDQFLNQAMTSAGEERQLVVNIQVGEKELASTLLQLNRRGFRTA